MIRRYIVREIGEHRGAPRIYLDTMALTSAGFTPGATYERLKEEGKLILRLHENGRYTVSKKDKGGETVPVIDINSKEGLSPLDGLKAVRLVIQDGMICMMATASQANAKRRIARLRENLANGRIVSASLSHGGGILDNAAHHGLQEAGIKPELAFANELDGALLEHSSSVNDVWGSDSIGIAAPMQEAVQDEWLMNRLPPVDILAVGIPCSGASRAGVSKRGLEMMEDHSEVGHLAASLLLAVQRVQPAIVVVECVKEYQKTASAQIIRSHLRDSGYQVNEVILNGKDFGVLENRTRWFMVAATNGITIDLDAMVPVCTPVRTVGEVLEQIPENDASWRDFQYLKIKAVRDAEKGNGFAMQIVDPSDTSVPVLRKGYHKGGSTDPLLKHPSQEGLYRLFTAKEHARIKQIPEHLVEGMSQTKAHELLGQSVLYAPVKALFKRIGQSLESCAESQTSTVPAYRLAQATG
jgi:DNA (cytosine-5)-methyltransferase 1